MLSVVAGDSEICFFFEVEMFRKEIASNTACHSDQQATSIILLYLAKLFKLWKLA